MSYNVFVDTNIFLSLYAYSDDDLEQLRSFFFLSRENEINFILPQQVVDEFWRNRESKIRESLDKIKNPPKIQVPALARDLVSADKFIAAQNDFFDSLREMQQEAIKRAVDNKLSADALIIKMFEESQILETSSEIFENAKKRVAIGNPPGKRGSLGDAINWECILKKLEFLDTIYFISKDSDYGSVLHEAQFNEFLKRELDETLCEVKFYSSLRKFISTEFSELNLEKFIEASEAISFLEASPNYAATHRAIEKLSNYDSFSIRQIQRLILAAEDNSQVRWIISDKDVASFYKRIEDEFGDMLMGEDQQRLANIVNDMLDPADTTDIESDISFLF